MEAALPLADNGDVECRNILKPLPDRATANAERLSDFMFARKPVTELEIARCDQLLNARSHFFGHASFAGLASSRDQVRLARILHAGLPSEVTCQTSLFRCLEAGRHRGLAERASMSRHMWRDTLVCQHGVPLGFTGLWAAQSTRKTSATLHQEGQQKPRRGAEWATAVEHTNFLKVGD